MDKKLEKIMESPPRSDIKMEDLVSVLQDLGFICRQGKGSHVVIKHKLRGELFTVVPTPHGHNNCVNKCYIKQVQELIKDLDE